MHVPCVDICEYPIIFNYANAQHVPLRPRQSKVLEQVKFCDALNYVGLSGIIFCVLLI